MSATRLHHELTGPAEAPVLVLGNSLGTTGAMWDPQLPVLAEHFRVLRYDMRGHGRSEVPPGGYTIDDLGRDALDLLDTLGLQRVAYCGLSLGGMVGMWLAAHAPQRISRLVLCCTSAHMPPPEFWLDRAARVRAHGMAAVADRVVERWFTPGFFQREPGTVARFNAMLSATPTEGYAGCCEAIAAMDLRPALSAISAPTLVVSGADDSAAPPEQYGAVIGAGIDGARLVVIDESAHLANVEAPDQVTAAVLDHLLVNADPGGVS